MCLFVVIGTRAQRRRNVSFGAVFVRAHALQGGSESPQRRGSFLVVDENMPSLLDAPRPSIDVESLEATQKQRRASMSMRRASLAEVIPDWPTLNRAPKLEQVLSRRLVPVLL